MTAEEWLRAYAMLVLRVDRRLTEAGGGLYLDYLGPQAWREEAVAEEPPPVERLVEDAEALLGELPFEPPRAAYLAAHARALLALARRESGVVVPLPELVRDTLGLEVAALPESVFEQAHEQLDRALPKTGGSIAERHRAWQAAHSLPVDQLQRLPELVGRAVDECRARTQAMITPLPADERVDCELETGVRYLAAAWHRGGTRSTILINGDRPFNLAALLYVVAHEGHPGHIAEQVLKEIHLVRRGHLEQQVRFLPSPPFALSEGLGLLAWDLIFPDDQAQVWLTDNILTEQGIRPDGSDFAAIHHARSVLFGAQANAALLAAEGRPDTEVADYLARWALLDDHQLGPEVEQLTAPGGHPYIFAYYHGWRLLRQWLDNAPDPAARIRRLLTEQLLPADLQPEDRRGRPLAATP